MPFRPSKWVIYAPVAVLPFLAALFIQGKSLPDDIRQRVSANLVTAGADWAKPVVEGRDVKLSGDSPSAEQVDQAIAAVLGTYGVRRVDSTVRIVEPPPAAPTIKPVSGFWGTFDITGTWPEGNGNALKLSIADQSWLLGTDAALTSDGQGNWTLKPATELPPGTYDVVAVAASASGLATSDASKDEITVAVPPELKPATIDSLVTNNAAPEIRGSFDPEVATSLSVAIGPSLYMLGDPDLTANGSKWTLVPSKPIADGTYDVILEVGDALGRKVSATAPGALTIDTVPPPAPIINPFGNELPVNITGSWPGKDAVSLVARLAGKLWTLGTDPALTSDGRGNWSFQPDIELAPGSYDFAVEAMDRAGNVTRNTGASRLVIPEPPPLPELTAPTVQSLITNAAAAVVKGTWPSAIAKTLTVQLGGKAYVLGADNELAHTADDWTLSLTAPLTDGDYDVSAEVTDEAGRSVSSAEPGKLTIDTVAPAVPAISPISPALPLKLSGSWAEGDAVSLAVKLAGQVWSFGKDAALASDGAGNWNLAPDLDLKPGTYDVEVEIIDRAGNVTRDDTKDELVIAETTEPTPPPPPPPPEMTAPTVTPAEVTIARPVIAGTWSELAASSLKVEIGGAAYVLGANAEIASDGIGNWSLTLPAALVDGTYDVVVTTADAAGTSLADATQNEIVIDAQGPAAPGVALYSGEQGPRQVTGTWDRQNAATLSVAIPAINLRETLGTGTALTSEAGEWTLLLQSELAPGSYDVAVETTDSKGRVARDQTRFEILVKGAPPPPPPPPPPEMKRPAITPYGGAETPAAIVGTWDEGVAKSLVVSIKGTSISASLGIEPRLTSDGGGNWALALSEKLPPGTYDVVAETLDEAGNHAMDGSMGELVITEPPPPPPPPYDCEGVFAAVAAAHPVRFAFDSWVITPADAEMVSKAAAVLADPRCLDRKAEVTGHADYFGGKLYNRALSIRRAQVVVDALVKGGVEPNRLSVTGLGEQSPDVPDRTRDARGKNRRVILTIVK